MSVLSYSAQITAFLNAFEKKINKRLGRFDIELKKINERVTHVYNAVAALKAVDNYHNPAQITAIKRREAADVRKAAAVAAQEARPFDPKNIYGTLVNTRGRVKGVLVDYATDAANKYLELETSEAVLELFTTNFKHWDESHFRSLPKKDTARLREVLLEKQISIHGGRFPAFRGLSQIIRNNNRAVAAAAAAADDAPVKPENVKVNGGNKVNAVSSPMSPPTKRQHTGNTNVAM